jgi:hypothetical protein
MKQLHNGHNGHKVNNIMILLSFLHRFCVFFVQGQTQRNSKHILTLTQRERTFHSFYINKIMVKNYYG